jgi:hypothetical protein
MRDSRGCPSAGAAELNDCVPKRSAKVVGVAQAAPPVKRIAPGGSEKAETVGPPALLLAMMKFCTSVSVAPAKPGRRMDELLPLMPISTSMFKAGGEPALKLLPVMAAHTSMSSAVAGAPAASPNPEKEVDSGSAVVLPVMVRLAS